MRTWKPRQSARRPGFRLSGEEKPDVVCTPVMLYRIWPQRISKPFMPSQQGKGANDDHCTGFRHASARSQLGSHVFGGGLGPHAGCRVGLEWVGCRITFHCTVLRQGAGRADRRGMAWPGIGGDGGRGYAVRGVDEQHRRPGRADRDAGHSGSGSLRDGVRRHGGPGAGRGQPFPAVFAGRDQRHGAKHRSDRGHRGAVRRDVGSGRGGDVRLCRLFGLGQPADVVHPASRRSPTPPDRRHRRPRSLRLPLRRAAPGRARCHSCSPRCPTRCKAWPPRLRRGPG